MLNKPEILAPAGNMKALVAAVKSGADGVYAGGDRFSARAFAGNFSREELIEAIHYCHIHNVRLYMAVNTLLKDSECLHLIDYLIPFYEAGIDGVIIQDMGAAKLIHDNLKNLPLHASTQLSVSSVYGAKLLRNLGFKRIVPARELSLKEIQKIKSECDMEIETFVHGAMCFAYSGKCLMSSFAGTRSGNRGRCAQICRKSYSSKYFENRYALSMKDMCTLDILPELIMAGIDSFKIEGRMKNEYYVYACVNAYKSVRDAVINGMQEASLSDLIDEQKAVLSDIYNRGGFSNGYYFMNNGHEMLSDARPNHNGIKAGKVCGINGNRVSILLDKDVNVKDVLEIRTGDKNIELTSNVSGKKNDTIVLNGNNIRLIKKGFPVYRTRNNLLIENISNQLKEDNPYINVDCRLNARIGHPLELVVGKHCIHGDIVHEAEKSPVSVFEIAEIMSKTGDTGISFNTQITADDNIFIRISGIKSLKREAAEAVYDDIKSRYARNAEISNGDTEAIHAGSECEKKNNPAAEDLCKNLPGVTVYVRTSEQLKIVNNCSFVNNIIIDYNICYNCDVKSIQSKDKKYIAGLPYVLRDDGISGVLSLIKDKDFSGVMVFNMDELGLLKYASYGGIIVASSFLYAYNRCAIKYYSSLFPDIAFIMSDELTEKELQETGLTGIRKCYGHQPLMITSQCFHKNYGSCPSDEILYLEDEIGNAFYAAPCCSLCYNIIYNGIPTYIGEYAARYASGSISGVFIDLSVEDGTKTVHIMDVIERILSGKENTDFDTAFTGGHYKRGID